MYACMAENIRLRNLRLSSDSDRNYVQGQRRADSLKAANDLAIFSCI